MATMLFVFYAAFAGATFEMLMRACAVIDEPKKKAVWIGISAIASLFWPAILLLLLGLSFVGREK